MGAGGGICEGCCTPVWDCVNCATTPASINVAFSGITAQNGVCFDRGGSSRDYKWENVPDLNDTYLVPQRGEATPCEYLQCFEVNVSFVEYNSVNGTCSGGVYNTISYDRMIIYVWRSSSFVKMRGWLKAVGIACDYTGYFSRERYFESGNMTLITKCFEVSGEASTITSGNFTPAYGGTVTITEN